MLLVKKAWGFAWFALYTGSNNPLLLISLLAFLVHPSFLWFVIFIGALVFHYGIQEAVNGYISLTNLRQATSEFLNVESGYNLKEIDNAPFFEEKDYSHILRNRRRLLRFVDESQLADFSPGLLVHPVRVFLATKKDGGIFCGAKAYTNPRGAGLIFLSNEPTLLNAFQRFLLFHELEHVSVRGAAQLSYMYACRFWGLIGIAFILSVASSLFDWVVGAVYTIEWFFKCWYTMPIMREVIADNGSLRKLSDAEQTLVAHDLSQMLHDHDQSSFPRPGSKRPAFMSQGQLIWRFKFVDKFIKRKAKNQETVIEFYHMTSPVFVILYGMLFFHLAMVTPVPPEAPLILMFLYAGASLAQTIHFYKLSAAANRDVNNYLMRYAPGSLSAGE